MAVAQLWIVRPHELMSAKQPVLIGLAIVAIVAIASVSFHVGRSYEAKRGTVIAANEGCFLCWVGLRALRDTNYTDLPRHLDSYMDLDAMILADMALKHPSVIGASQYQLLRNVRDFRERYGRSYDYMKGYQPNPADVDARIDKALVYLESIHGTNSGSWYSWRAGSEDVYLDEPVQNAKHGK